MNKKQLHIQELFLAMLQRKRLVINGLKTNSVIQCINLDGECDIYSTDFKEVTMRDVPHNQIKVDHNTILKP